MRVLFIGNSHTYYNDMPGIFAQILRDNGEDVQVTMLARAYKGWDYHVKEPETIFNILYGAYDAVVLQHSAHPMGDLEVMEEAGKKLIDLVKKSGARPILYMTWTKAEDGEEKQNEMSAAYRKLQVMTGAECAPVGDVWWNFHRACPEVELYAEDGSHASKAGSSLAAVTIAETILGRTLGE